ncbi:EF-hand [Anaeromyces robustus]|uniref:EF-hand n=1 Tax=Anaeromyces robustus TaxID=1754192 RepID=A0A1Y1XJX3_9FUNG|nr:EF-hand [Anaeromyces robustus]|eukprot:ORX86050.1 EF-hand [Anaeromyces robustus]
MKVLSKLLNHLHLDPKYGVLNAQSAQVVYELFRLIDFRGTGALDDIQFTSFLQSVTNLSQSHIEKIFYIFDLDRSGSVEFDEFYLLVCILIAVNNNEEKQFMYRHWSTCFELLDEDGSKSVSKKEFETLGVLFNFGSRAVDKIFSEFDVSGTREMNYNEFKLFMFAAMDTEIEMERQQLEKKKQKETSNTTTQLKYIADYLNKKRAKNKKKKRVQPI